MVILQELTNSRKVCLGVNGEAEMLGIQAAARSKGDWRLPLRSCIQELGDNTYKARKDIKHAHCAIDPD